MQISYKPGSGLLHRLNPLTKGTVAFAAIIFFSVNNLSGAVIATIIAGFLLICKLSGVALLDVIMSIRRIGLLLVIVALIQGFSVDGFNPMLAVEAVLRIVGVFLVAGVYLTISSQSELTCFWEACFRPLALIGFPAREFALIMVIAVRFFPVILGEIERIRMAQIARGARLNGGGLLSSATALMPLMIPTLTQAVIRAGELAQAMEARGYRVSAQRTRYQRFRFGFIDLIAASVPLLIFYYLLRPFMSE
ncbi:MAG: energy-coupling factor transporter transmembrane protein EcfT [Candidatus Riflebacteria bacterium]|nr:energy-coupling factor transporter transmembrane protein EcfT [Candidatus Riflebacteria bacterium]